MNKFIGGSITEHLLSARHWIFMIILYKCMINFIFIFTQMWKLRFRVYFRYLLRAMHLVNKWQHFNPGPPCTLLCLTASQMKSLSQESNKTIWGWHNPRVRWNFTGGFMTLAAPQINSTKQMSFPTPAFPWNKPKMAATQINIRM